MKTPDSLHELSGSVYGTRVRGRMPADFTPYLWPGREEGSPGTGPEVRTLELEWRRAETLPEAAAYWRSEVTDPARFALVAPLQAAAGPRPEAREERRTGPSAGAPFPFALRVDGEVEGTYLCRRSRLGIAWASAPAAAPHYLFTYALPLWLEARGVPVLHGSAVTVGGRAVGFLGASGVGKSVLCAQLVRRGCGFLSDDGIALEPQPGGAWTCLPGPPLLRLWPSGLVHQLETGPDPLPPVRHGGDKRRLSLDLLHREAKGGDGGGGAGGPETGGATARESRGPRRPHRAPLARLYLLRRRPDPGGSVAVERLGTRDGLVHLLAHGVAAEPAAALGLAARRFETLSRVAAAVPVRRLTFPGGPDATARVLEALEHDLEGA